ncbi:hypothetical protein BJY52DRAFT_1315735 [Lactarius psammicola]|nr:hypothetical protein BJY52DRAFT_1315735 [Lactarius psammicola]
MATMRAALLDQELGFTIRILDPVQSDLPEGQDEGQVQGSPDGSLSQTTAAVSAGQTIEGLETASEGAANDSNESEDRRATPVLSTNIMGAVIDLNEPSAFVLAGPNSGLDGADLINPASYGHLINGSNHEQPLTLDIPGYKTPDSPYDGPNLTVSDGASAPKDALGNDAASFRVSPSTLTNSTKPGYPATTSTRQQGCSTTVGVEPFRSTHAPPHHDPAKLATKKAERTKQTVEWLVKELENRPGYAEFRSTLDHVRDNAVAVRSWTFAVDFVKAYNKSRHPVNGVYQKIKKIDATRALGVGSTWFCDATKAVSIVEKYGEGSTHRSQPVIDKVTAGTPEGSTKLLQWLRTWEIEHPT